MVSSCHVAKGQQLPDFRHLQVRRQHAGTAEDRLDPGEQFACGKGFDQIVVGSHLKADDPVRLIAPSGQHQDRRGFVLARPELTAEHEPVIARHHHIKDDQVDPVGFEK